MVDNKIDNFGRIEYSQFENYEGDLKELKRDGYGVYNDEE